jgi:hypothetical protein
MEPLSEGGKGLDRLINILENIGKISEAAETGIEIKDKINEYLKENVLKISDPNTVYCRSCNQNVLLDEQGIPTFYTSDKIPSDTIESHNDTLHSKYKSTNKEPKKKK